MTDVDRVTQHSHRALGVLVLALAGCGDASRSPTPPVTPPRADSTPTLTVRPVAISIAVDQDRAPISPLIYGTNQDAGASFWTVRRNGGNRTTGYNWETNVSNAGSDYRHNSDLFAMSYLGLPASEATIPGRSVTYNHDLSVAMGAESIVTLQLAGYVAADANGPVTEAEAAPSPRWNKVAYRKPTAFTTMPDLTDGTVYMDEQVNLLVRKYGGAAAPTGVRFYSLDNEPAVWANTHPRIHSPKVGAQELLDRSVALATATKAVDPKAQILGPSEYGISGFVSLQSALDWTQLKGTYSWYLDFYLDGMKKAEQASGKRLLDVLDVHWYPEAKGDHRITDQGAVTAADVEARLQAPRTLWDAAYQENSWVQQVLPSFLPILPRLQRSIAQYYPGTKLAITEYDFGGKNTISGGIAQADVLGAFAKNDIYLATIWGIGSGDLFALSGFRLYRDYNGRKGTFGSTRVRSTTADIARTSVYASVDGNDNSLVHVILLNKGSDPVAATVQLTGGVSYTSGEVWGFDATSAQITARPAISGIGSNSFTYAVPPLTALHMILRK